jgi:hypothetical protein
VAVLGGFEVHHFAAQASVRESKRIEHGVDVVQANAIDEHVRGGVVADCDHHGGKVAQCDAGYPGSESAHDVAVGDQIRRSHRVEIGKFEFSLLCLAVEFGEDRDLDGTGLGKDFILVEKEVIAGREIFDGDARNSVEILIDIVNRGFQFLPKDLALFSGGRRRLTGSCLSSGYRKE